MEVKVTRKVDSHHTNPRYRCLLVDLLNDSTFHHRIENGVLVKADFMPTDEFVMELVRRLCKRSPTFRDLLLDFAVRL